MKQRKDTSVTVSVPKVERDKWRKYADERKMTMSGFVRKAVNVYVAMLERANR